MDFEDTTTSYSDAFFNGGAETSSNFFNMPDICLIFVFFFIQIPIYMLLRKLCKSKPKPYAAFDQKVKNFKYSNFIVFYKETFLPGLLYSMVNILNKGDFQNNLGSTLASFIISCIFALMYIAFFVFCFIFVALKYKSFSTD
mmetsp:Transcript_7354/g.6588  ORF Transcript_7354/g.6588 Transcript_7354/m.6588 type:complete len:142 (+) Transcript_7354:1296-1721(+)|eukprot:CAMPEP_0170549236 /NCGR_PEP_ID=MMETSP0211-20121228/7422_1 /TAXON_ID=311385 /ORGANISM="Pseudokeronopsis sp., Strain OXSARD2" /LENGTH=141 /DNA_ID=CAMNT_0010855153 /DNA_START=1242 /DNA_END=1667 /DNA_ORIENTATION=+